ncbi:MAG TPA: hypothetical protein VEK79_25150 [Thermoanaerobaculia bacterium]|nr:hypothetical protein [Thermoanaerobaculia bacterium]
MRRLIAFAVFTLVIVGCQGESSPTGTDGVVAFTNVYKAQVSGVASRRGEVISQASRWAEIWTSIASGPPPSVNLDESLLIFVAGGDLSSCSDFKVNTVRRVSGELRIDVVEERRTANCACPAIVARPVHVVSVPRAATGAAFEFRIVNVSGCP